MHPSWIALILTASQAVLVAALPKPQTGQSIEWVEIYDENCNNETEIFEVILTRTIAAALTPIASDVTNQPVIDDVASSGSASSSSVTTVAIPGVSIETITLTSLPTEQTPTVTSAKQSLPDTTGSINTALNTTGVVSSQPFNTSIPTVTSNTLQPIDTTVSSVSGIGPSPTNTLTVPISTFQTVITSLTITSLPVPTTISITQVTVFTSNVTSAGSVIATSSVGVTVLTTGGTALSETTVTEVSTATGTISTTFTATGRVTSLPTLTASCLVNTCSGQNIFLPVALNPPPANIQSRGGHPVPPLGIAGTTSPIETNKFYANFFLGGQGSPSIVQPYSLIWSKGSGNAQSWGMAIQHIEEAQKVFGPVNQQIPGSPASYYINPLGIQSIILSAAELGSSTVMTSDSLEAFSANIHLQPNTGSSSSITFPIVQGMGFVTGIYNNLRPAIQSSVFFRSVTAVGSPKNNIFKYRLTLEDGKVWLLYAMPSATGLTPNLQLVSSTLLQGIAGWSGVIQVAKVPDTSFEALYDNASGLYPTSGAVGGFATGSTGEYSLSWTKAGAYANNGTLLMYALPHHVASFSSGTAGAVTGLQLATTTKGIATAVVADYWSLTEQLPTTMGFAPWRPGTQVVTSLSAAAVAALQQVAPTEASQNIGAQSNLNSMYYSGKALSKFASIIWTMMELSNQKLLANNALIELIQAFQVFTDNRQQYPLVYDTVWKGVVSSATYVTGDDGVDFGNTLYNDHHFHYGYFIHAAAIIGSYNSTWLALNRDYVNALVRDVSNPSSLDTYFPIFRSFDWYNGHSWAKGLFESGDGKDEESSSEDAMFAYALKMWGQTSGDASMEARGNLMLAVLARSLQSYFLLESNNKNQPASFIGNKVTGILFENKVDHTTYFGANFEYIQGIHMIPLQPFSTLTRTQQFVTEEWNTYFADGAVAQASNIVGGWKGILFANLAIINPKAAYNFFTQSGFDASWLDGGASRTWYIAFAAGLGGA